MPNINVWIELHVLVLCRIWVFLFINLSPLTAKWKVCCFWQTDSLFFLFLCLIFSVVFMSVPSLLFSCLFSPPLSHWFFFIHSCIFLVSCLTFVIQTSIPYIPQPLYLFGWYINTHSRALPTTLPLLAPCAFCWPPPPQWPLHPVRGFCCRITLSLLRSELCSPPITMTGEVTLMRGYLTPLSWPTWSQTFLSPMWPTTFTWCDFKYGSNLI